MTSSLGYPLLTKIILPFMQNGKCLFRGKMSQINAIVTLSEKSSWKSKKLQPFYLTRTSILRTYLRTQYSLPRVMKFQK